MDRPKQTTSAGWTIYQLPDGSWFPALLGADGPSVPQPDPGLVSKQNELLQMQIDNAKEVQDVKPLLLESAGIRRNADGKFEYIDPTLQANKREIEALATRQALQAMKGELPVSTALAKELELGQARLNERLYRQQGPGYYLSTPGQNAQREFETMANTLKENERYGRVNTLEGISQARGAGRTSDINTFTNPYASYASLLEPGSNSIARAREQDNYTRGLQFQAGAAAGQERAGYTSAGIGLAGLLGYAAMMAPAAASDPALKTDIEPVSDIELLAAVTRIPVSRWRYKGDPTKTVMVGGMAPDMPKEVAPTGKYFNVVSYLGMLTGAVRALDRKIDEKLIDSPASLLVPA